MSVGGLSNTEIGDRLGYSKQHVSNVLNLEQAEVLRNQLIQRMRDAAMQDIPTRLHEIAVKTVDRIHRLVHSDEVFEKSPFAVIDRGMEVVKGLGHLKHGNTEHPVGGITVHGNAVIGMPDALGQRIADGLEKAHEARALNPPKQLTNGDSKRETGTPVSGS
jgi:hypothetical protein